MFLACHWGIMKKFLNLIFTIIIVVVLCAVIAYNSLPSYFSKHFTNKAQVSISISDFIIRPSTLTIENLQISNPPKSILRKAFDAQKIELYAPISEYFHDQIVIDDMTIDNTYIGLEFESPKNSRGNWQTILNNIKPPEEKEQNRSILIKKLVFTDLRVELVYREGSQNIRKLKPIDRLELTNISSKGGVPTDQIMHIILSEMVRNILSLEGLQNLIEDVVPGARQAGSVLRSVKGFFLGTLDEDNESVLPTAE